MSRPVINPGTLVCTYDHWHNCVRAEDSDAADRMVSLYHIRYSAAGEGHVAVVDVPGFCCVCTDRPGLIEFVVSTIGAINHLFDPDRPQSTAEFSRRGDMNRAPSWSIQTGGHRIESTWSALRPPIITEGFAPTFEEDLDYFTLLFFCDQAIIEFDGKSIPGSPFKSHWKSIGKTGTSCVIGQGEAMIQCLEQKADKAEGR